MVAHGGSGVVKRSVLEVVPIHADDVPSRSVPCLSSKVESPGEGRLATPPPLSTSVAPLIESVSYRTTSEHRRAGGRHTSTTPPGPAEQLLLACRSCASSAPCLVAQLLLYRSRCFHSSAVRVCQLLPTPATPPAAPYASRS